MSGDIYIHGVKTPRADYEQAAKKLANDFAGRGLGPDDVIALLMRNDLNFMIIAEAARLIGLRYVAINWHGVALETVSVLKSAEAKLFIAHADLLAAIVDDLPEGLACISVAVSPELAACYDIEAGRGQGVPDLAGLIEAQTPWEKPAAKFRGMYAFTSGSTGMPKGIKRDVSETAPDRWQTYAALSQMLMKQQPGDRFYCAAPLYHSAPNALSAITMAAGGVDLFVDSKFEPEGFLQIVERYGITHAYLVPTMMVRMLKLDEATRQKYDISTLRYCVSTGSPWPHDVKAAMIDWFGPILYESYGASEIGFMTLISSQEALQKPGSVGRILEGGDVKVLDDDGKELPPGEVGTLYIHLPIFGDFDYTNTDAHIEENRYGAYTTVGDMGSVDEDGYIFISDRKKDMIISGGANIFPAEIEAQLILMPEVADCAVFGAPDPEFGEIIVAAITLKDGASADLAGVRAWLEPRLTKFKIPRKLDIHDSLPRQESGKIFKAKLRAPYWDEAGRSV